MNSLELVMSNRHFSQWVKRPLSGQKRYQVFQFRSNVIIAARRRVDSLTRSAVLNNNRFIIADITDAKSIPQELSHIIPFNPSLPVAAIIAKKFQAYAMYEHFEHYPWVLPLYKYESKEQLLGVLKEKVIDPAEQKANELRKD